MEKSPKVSTAMECEELENARGDQRSLWRSLALGIVFTSSFRAHHRAIQWTWL